MNRAKGGPLTSRRVRGGRRERDVLGLEERPDLLAVDGDLGVVGRRLQAVRSRVRDRAHAVAPDEDREQKRGRGQAAKGGSRCYFHFRQNGPWVRATNGARGEEREREKRA